MAETAEVKSPEVQKSPDTFTTTADVMNKFAENLSQKKAQAKQEAARSEPKTETTNPSPTTPPVAETKAPEAEKDAAKVEDSKSEAPKDPVSNGQSDNPKKEVEPAKTETPVTPPEETDWRKELGFEDSTKEDTKEVKKNDNSKLLKEYELKAKEYDDISSDPFIAAYSAAKKAGKDANAFVSEIKGVDVNALTPEQVWDANLKAEGLSEDDIAIEMEKFSELSPFEKKQKTKEFRKELISQQNEQLKKYAADNTTQAQDKKKLALIAQEQGKKFFEKIKDKDWQGMKMTSSEINKLENFLEKEYNFINADGTLNYELYAETGNYALNGRTILQNTYKKGEARGYEKALLEISRPSSNDRKFNSAPEVKITNKSEQARKAAKEAFNPA